MEWTLNPWQFSSDTWKLISSVITWLCLKKKEKNLHSFLTFALFPLTSHCLARICSEHCLEICITSTSCVCWPLYSVLLIVFLNCKSLWIKASAKWINVNANIFTSLHTYSHRHTYKCFGNVCFPWRSSRKTSNSPKKIIDGFGGVVCLSLENACMSQHSSPLREILNYGPIIS